MADQPPPGPRTYQNITSGAGSTQYNGDVHGGVVNNTSNVYQNQKTFHERLLESLYFAGMSNYQTRPLESYGETYKWMFDPGRILHSCRHCGNTSDPWRRCGNAIRYSQLLLKESAKLRNWLSKSDEIFWISGKAGAGKSCLMKFLLEHERTLELLRLWTGNTVNVAGCFFWAAGDELSKSHAGLSRSLLYQILNHQPVLADYLLPAYNEVPNNTSPWTLKRLRNAFQTLTSEAKVGTSFAFFIDGLDEFTGDMSDLIETLDTLNQSPKIKLGVSSRPWNIFVNSYGSRSDTLQLRLHDLTRYDIDEFIRGRLEDTKMFQQTLSDDRSAYQIIDAVQDRADGVFLWVSLAVKRLRRLAEDFSSTAEMLEAVEEMPAELELFLQQILDSIEPVHRKFAARTFLIMLEVGNNRIPTSWLLYVEDNPHVDWSLGLARISKDGGKAAKRWCKDLVHVIHDTKMYDPGPSNDFVMIELNLTPCHTISFPHRSIWTS